MKDGLKFLIYNGSYSMAEYDHLANDYRSKGITVIPCPFGGEEILDCIYKESPDVVIMDLFMPRVDALGVLHEVSKKPLTKKITFIVLSSFDSSEFNKKLYANGVGKVVIKPCDVRLLISDIATDFSDKK